MIRYVLPLREYESMDTREDLIVVFKTGHAESVLAAADGVVQYASGGTVRIQHGDGCVSVYQNLMPGSEMFEVCRAVNRGMMIGMTKPDDGMIGFSVEQFNRRLPVSFHNPQRVQIQWIPHLRGSVALKTG